MSTEGGAGVADGEAWQRDTIEDCEGLSRKGMSYVKHEFDCTPSWCSGSPTYVPPERRGGREWMEGGGVEAFSAALASFLFCFFGCLSRVRR